MSLEPYYSSEDFRLYLGDCVQVIKKMDARPNLIFADPPYFLSSDGYTVQSGNIVSVHKGQWDKLKNHNSVDEFNYEWLSSVRDIMPKDGTIWISGTFHNIFSIAQQITALNFRILNTIVWEKTNPPPNFSTRVFTHSTEIIIWARKEDKTAHFFNYSLMKKLNDNKQMKDVWRLPAIAPWEKKQGKHPVQKPLSLLSRIILANSKRGDLILDPFCGSSTTGIAANLLGRKYIGIDSDSNFLDLSIKRKEEINLHEPTTFLNKIKGLNSDIYLF